MGAVRTELLDGTVSRIAIVIFSYGNSNKSGGGSAGGIGTGDVQIMERFMLDVSAFPIVDKDSRNAVLEWGSSRPSSRASSRSASPTSEHQHKDEDDGAAARSRSGSRELHTFDYGVGVNLSEQFRAALISLTTRCAQLTPLPENCSFNVSMELKDEVDVDPPMSHPQVWMPVQPSLQKTGRRNDKNARMEDEGEEGSTQESKEQDRQKKGKDLGGARVTPIRTVEAGTFRFETWIEEASAKFEEKDGKGKGKGKAKVSFSSFED